MQNQKDKTPPLFPDLDNIHARYIIQLEKRIETLKDLCRELNPYEPLTEEQILILARFDITDTNDPFKMTNLLLMQLEDAITELKNLKE